MNDTSGMGYGGYAMSQADHPAGRQQDQSTREIKGTAIGAVLGADPWIHRADNMKCKTCMWFVPKAVSQERRQELGFGGMGSPLYDMGRCRRHAPAMGGYPVVMVNDWCGDHRLDENKFRAG